MKCLFSRVSEKLAITIILSTEINAQSLNTVVQILVTLNSYNSILASICYFLSVATASQQEQPGDFLSSVRVDENSQEMLFEEGSEQSTETKNR